jgi:hypothetical protein
VPDRPIRRRRPTNVTIDRDQYAGLRLLAEHRSSSVSGVLREMIRECLDRELRGGACRDAK